MMSDPFSVAKYDENIDGNDSDGSSVLDDKLNSVQSTTIQSINAYASAFTAIATSLQLQHQTMLQHQQHVNQKVKYYKFISCHIIHI